MFDLLFGNDGVKKILSREIENGILSHAYIFEGCDGSGKHTLAYETAVALYENSVSVGNGVGAFDKILSAFAPHLRSKVLFERFRDDLCPDVKIYSAPKDRKTIGVDTVRDIFGFVTTTPNELDFKVLIIEAADTMTVQAQNALLKLLEEPQGNVYFFLLCQNALSLISTVRSRAAVLRTETFSDDYLVDLFMSETLRERFGLDVSSSELEAAVRYAGGSIGRVLDGLESLKKKSKVTQCRAKVSELLKLIVDRRSSPLLPFVMKLPTDRSLLVSTLEMFEFALRDLLYVKAFFERKDGSEMYELPDGSVVGADEISKCEVGKGGNLLFFALPGDAVSFSAKLGRGEIVALSCTVDSAIESLEKNGNVKLTLVKIARDMLTALKLA